MDQTIINNLFKNHKEQTLLGRYIRLVDIQPLIDKLPSSFKVEVIGRSVLGKNINSITIGSGSQKVLMWSQMHGNESTTTKAVFDLLNTFSNDGLKSILDACTIKIIPMLNPDGSEVYTRLNANLVDLNRDAQDLTQPESNVLIGCFNAFKPDFCFNLHGQRTMYSVLDTNKTATLSFLSPAEDKNRSITATRKKAMEIIGEINKVLQDDLPHQIGRYDDGFNINCVGDTFQNLKSPTILFEAGHYKDDYNREEVRRLVFKSLVVALNYISNTTVLGGNYEAYFKIPENGKRFYDIIIRNAQFENKIQDIGINYVEKLVSKSIKFIPKVIIIDDLSQFFGHKELDANNYKVYASNNQLISLGTENDFVTMNNEKFSLNLCKY